MPELVLIANVGEEGEGNLSGMRYHLQAIARLAAASPPSWFSTARAPSTSPARRSAAAASSSPFPDPAGTVGAITAPAILSTP